MKTDHSTAYVRQEDAPLLPPPRNETGIIGWFNQNILSLINDFSGIGAAIRSVLMAVGTLAILYYSAHI